MELPRLVKRDDVEQTTVRGRAHTGSRSGHGWLSVLIDNDFVSVDIICSVQHHQQYHRPLSRRVTLLVSLTAGELSISATPICQLDSLRVSCRNESIQSLGSTEQAEEYIQDLFQHHVCGIGSARIGLQASVVTGCRRRCSSADMAIRRSLHA